MDYSHTQKGRLHLILYAAAALMLGFMWLPGTPLVAAVALGAAAAVMVLCAQAFQTLTVEDEGQLLAIRFGPLPLFSKRIPYDRITDV